MVKVIEERRHRAGFLLSEANGRYSRHVVTIAGGFTGAGRLEPGTVLGKITATSKYAISPDTGSDGSEIPDAILYDEINLANGDVDAVVINRAAEVNGNLLIFDPSVDSDAKRKAKCLLLDVPHKNEPIVTRAPFMEPV
jgi:hypothetical protein